MTDMTTVTQTPWRCGNTPGHDTRRISPSASSRYCIIEQPTPVMTGVEVHTCNELIDLTRSFEDFIASVTDLLDVRVQLDTTWRPLTHVEHALASFSSSHPAVAIDDLISDLSFEASELRFQAASEATP